MKPTLERGQLCTFVTEIIEVFAGDYSGVFYIQPLTIILTMFCNCAMYILLTQPHTNFLFLLMEEINEPKLQYTHRHIRTLDNQQNKAETTFF